MNPTNNSTTTPDDGAGDLLHDTVDRLLDSLCITKVQRRTSAGGVWVKGTMGQHRFDALVFPEHAEQPDFELGGSRISKLWVQRIGDRATVANFDRGWDLRPTTPAAAQIVDLLAAGLAEHIYHA